MPAVALACVALGVLSCDSPGGGSGGCDSDQVNREEFTPKCRGFEQVEFERTGGYQFWITPSTGGTYTLSQIHLGSHEQPNVILDPAVPLPYGAVSAIFAPSSQLIDEQLIPNTNCVGDDFHPRLTLIDSCGNQTTIRAEVVNSGQDVNLEAIETFLYQQGGAASY